jgi:hypothetical protein
MDEAGGLWVRLRVPFARRRYAEEFALFEAFVMGFSRDVRRALKNEESQAMADDAVLLRLLDVDAMFSSAVERPGLFRMVPGYRRKNSPLCFREWLVLHELHLKSHRHPQAHRIPLTKGHATV